MKQSQNFKNFFSIVLRFGLSGFLLWFIFRKIDFHKVQEAIAGADFVQLGIAFLFFLLANFFILSRWFIFIRALKLTVEFLAVIYWFFIGLFGNLFLPTGIGGDVIKIMGLCGQSSDKTKVVASVVLDRLSGFAGIVVTSFVAFLFGYKLIQDSSITISILVMAIVSGAIALVIFNRRIFGVINQMFSFLPKFQTALQRVQDNFLLMRSKAKEGFLAIGASCMAQVMLAISFYFIARALHQDIHLGYFLVFSPMVCVTSSLPSIGGLGVREMGWALLFSRVGLMEHVAVSMSLINFLMMVLLGLVGGVLYVASLFTRRIQHSQKDAGLK